MKRRMRDPIPSINEQFVSDAWNTLEHPITAMEIAELWLDTMEYFAPTEDDWRDAVKECAKDVRYYLP